MSDEQWQRPPQYRPGAVPPPPHPTWTNTPPQDWWTSNQTASQTASQASPPPSAYPPYTYPTYPPVHPPAKRSRPRRTLMAIAAGVTALAVIGGGIALTSGSRGSSQKLAFLPYSQGTTTTPSNPYSGSGSGSSQFGQGQLGGGSSDPQQVDPNSGGTSGGTGSTGTTGTATAAQSIGVVDINTILDYGSAEAAGTGIVLTSNGEILTNNHVVNGSTSISVTIVSTGKKYTAKVVGTDPTDDVAVIQLQGASGLATAKLGDSSKVAVGDTVTAVGNAGGTGGTPSSATGTVTGLNQSLTATDSDGSNSENLTGMIEVNADIQAGDSGGPLYASNGTVIGIDTAASSSRSATTTGYAIPLAKATAIADKIEAGQASSTIHLGYPAFLGVQLQSADSFGGVGTGTTGAPVSGVVDNSGAAKAGLAAGDTITSLNGTAIASADGLSSAVAALKPGQSVSIAWVDSSGQSHTGTITLGEGPAD